MTKSEVIDAVDALASRFLGIDVQKRRDRGSIPGARSVFWGGQWRARLVTSKNERDEYRITVYGNSFTEAVTRLIDAVAGVDAAAYARAQEAIQP